MSTEAEPPSPLDEFSRARYLAVTTYRRDGRAVTTPVWFLVRDGVVWARSDVASGKAKRVRNEPRVKLAPCLRDGTPTGPSVPAVAALVPRAEQEGTYDALLRRYGLTARAYDLYWTRLRRVRTVLLRFSLDAPTRPPRTPS